MFPPVGNVFPLLGKVVFADKKNRLPLMENIFPVPGKIVFTGKNMFPLKENLLLLLGKVVFACENMCFHYPEKHLLQAKLCFG